MHNLTSIISPVSEMDFHTNYFEKKPLLIQRNNPQYFSALLTMVTMSKYLERKDIGCSQLRMVKDGIQLPTAMYTKNNIVNNNVTELIDNEKLFNLFDDGASIVCQQLHLTFPSLYKFTQNLTNYFKLRIGLNTYLTPNTSQAFNPHYDAHDVFILQVHGSKLWRLYDMPVIAPIDRFNRSTWEMKEPSLEVELKQGDSLYIPRGMVHDAITADNVSLHITLGLSIDTWVDVFKLLIAETAPSIDDFRNTLHCSTLTADELKQTVSKLLQQLTEQIDYTQLLNDVKQKYSVKDYEIHSERFDDILNNKSLSEASVVFLRKQASIIISEDSYSITLAIRDEKLKFRLSEKELINEVLATNEFTVAEFISKYPSLAVIRNIKTLIKHGILGIRPYNKVDL